MVWFVYNFSSFPITFAAAADALVQFSFYASNFSSNMEQTETIQFRMREKNNKNNAGRKNATKSHEKMIKSVSRCATLICYSSGIQNTSNECWTIFLYPTIPHVRLKRHNIQKDARKEKTMFEKKNEC